MHSISSCQRPFQIFCIKTLLVITPTPLSSLFTAQLTQPLQIMAMKLFNALITLSAAIAFAIVASALNLESSSDNLTVKNEIASYEIQEAASLRGMNRFLAQQNLKADMRCDKFPRVCRLKNSPGPDCCKKKCVNVKSDRLNCGMCGYKCKYNEICCKGNCVNASFDKRNCGGCNNKCKKGEYCVYGMCNYA